MPTRVFRKATTAATVASKPTAPRHWSTAAWRALRTARRRTRPTRRRAHADDHSIIPCGEGTGRGYGVRWSGARKALSPPVLRRLQGVELLLAAFAAAFAFAAAAAAAPLAAEEGAAASASFLRARARSTVAAEGCRDATAASAAAGAPLARAFSRA